jgi:hypothetical protein
VLLGTQRAVQLDGEKEMQWVIEWESLWVTALVTKKESERVCMLVGCLVKLWDCVMVMQRDQLWEVKMVLQLEIAWEKRMVLS